MNQDLERLMEQYAAAKNSADRLVRQKLKHIAELSEECEHREMVFAQEICAEFCRLFGLLEQKYTQKEVPQPEQQVRMAQLCEKYKTGEGVLNAFYNHYKENKHIDYCRIEGYPFKDGLDRKEKISVTLRDYTARIKTFARRYLPELIQQGDVPTCGDRDAVLFTYAYLKEILDSFDIMEGGKPNKQRQNIRCALRKFYDFQCAMQEG